jgi:hypothetical protein
VRVRTPWAGGGRHRDPGVRAPTNRGLIVWSMTVRSLQEDRFMRHARWIVGAAVILTLGVASAPSAQLPGGVQLPGASLLSKDALLAQAKQLLGELTSMKSSGALQPAQAAQVDTLLPKATSLRNELEKPQVDATRLSTLSKDLGDMQKQVAALKGMIR